MTFDRYITDSSDIEIRLIVMFVAAFGEETPLSSFGVDGEVFFLYPTLCFVLVVMTAQAPFPE